MRAGTMAALLLAGSILFYGNASGRVARGVKVDGADVGGMKYAQAEELLRGRILADPPELFILTPQERRRVPSEEFDFTDDLSCLLRRAKAGESLRSSVRWEWADAERYLFSLCEEYARESADAEISFSAEGFSYTEGADGVFCRYRLLIEDALSALRRGGGEVVLHTESYSPARGEAQARAETELLARCATRFDGSNLSRAHNVALAAERISGSILLPREEFSFNKAVGERTEENGFRTAPVISDGKFVPGVGGGVCQTSSTLFGAALTAGLHVIESHPHSLAVGYVSPSLDAMVSSGSDLRFVNPYPDPVYLLAEAGEGELTVSVYGKRGKLHYETESVVLYRVPPPAPLTDENASGIVRPAREGLRSESFLLTYDAEGNLLSRNRIRSDLYAAVQGIYGTKPENGV